MSRWRRLPEAGDRGEDGTPAIGWTRAERVAPDAIVLAQRCFTYKGELKCF